MTTQINRYNPDGTENLDYWFGVRETRNNNSAYTMTINTPRYVRYTMENLKKRSTERLNKMFNNLFGYTTDRYSMIEKLFVELNNQWNTYEEKLATLVVSYQNMTKGKGTRGRKPKFEDTQVYNMVADYVVRGMKLTEIRSEERRVGKESKSLGLVIEQKKEG